jgi:RNA polymerase sigma-70 factor, ECF subfamily
LHHFGKKSEIDALSLFFLWRAGGKMQGGPLPLIKNKKMNGSCFLFCCQSSNYVQEGAPTMDKVSAETFESIYYEYSDKIYGYIFMYVNNKEIAEDLTQDTFIKAYKNFHQFNGESHIFTWLVRISRNVAIDYLRKRNRFKFFSIEKYQFDSGHDTPVEIMVKGEKTARLYDAIHALKLSYQEVLILRKIKEFSIRETAQVLGWNENKVKITTSRAMAALKKEMEKRGDTLEGVI